MNSLHEIKITEKEKMVNIQKRNSGIELGSGKVGGYSSSHLPQSILA